MSKARLLQDFLIPGKAENENTLIANYWLEFVSARDEREEATPIRFTESDLRERMREFQKQMNAVVRDRESLHKALAGEHFEPPIHATTVADVPWAEDANMPVFTHQVDEEDGEDAFEEPYNRRPLLTASPLSTLLLKILGK